MASFSPHTLIGSATVFCWPPCWPVFCWPVGGLCCRPTLWAYWNQAWRLRGHEVFSQTFSFLCLLNYICSIEFLCSSCSCGFPPASLVFYHPIKHAGGLVISFAPRCEWVCAQCPEMACTILCSWDRLQLHYDPDLDKELSEDEWIVYLYCKI